MKLVAIGGSLRPQSITYQVLKIVVEKIYLQQGIASELIDLRHLDLPFCTGEGAYLDYPDVGLLRQKVQSAAGILLATPEYHGSVSGVLKNALDLLEQEHLGGKMVGLIAVVGGVHSTNAINILRTVCRQLHCWVLPDQIVIEQAETIFNEKGQLINPLLDSRVNRFANNFIDAVKKFNPTSF